MPGMVACACHPSTGQAGTVDLGTKGLASLAQLVSSGPVRVPVWKEEDDVLKDDTRGLPLASMYTCAYMFTHAAHTDTRTYIQTHTQNK